MYTQEELRNRLQALAGTKQINLPLKDKGFDFQVSIADVFEDQIHYEICNHRLELHFEMSYKYGSVPDFFRKELPEDSSFEWGECGFAVYYRLKRQVDQSDLEDVMAALTELYDKVNPVVEKYLTYMEGLADIAKEFGDYYRKEREKLPYHINLIDELHANENAHTRILVKLLKYYRPDAGYVILRSFMERMGIAAGNVSVPTVHSPRIDCNNEFIDALIEEPRKYGIIIENKVHNAVDQQKQLETYMNRVLSHGVALGNIWVIYLTRDGSKEVSETSITPERKAKLGRRFVPMNYREHILPWLKEKVLPNCLIKEEWLVTALKQYIDHLEGMFGLRSVEADMNRALQQHLLTIYNVDEYKPLEVLSTLKKGLRDTEALNTTISILYKKTKNKILSPFLELTREIYEELGEELKINKQDTFIQFYPAGKAAHIHLEWVSFSAKTLLEEATYQLDFHIEKNDGKARAEFLQHAEVQKWLQGVAGLDEDGMKDDVLFSKSYSTPGSKPFYELSRDEQKAFLKTVYEDTYPLFKLMKDLSCS
ncbi:MAG: PD-(D/E)XK nuclease family protein [Tannerellaceae bacterium]|nr:PD-(D/E)XK nuclease family protein [Tannerellaceae bacterium]